MPPGERRPRQLPPDPSVEPRGLGSSRTTTKTTKRGTVTETKSFNITAGEIAMLLAAYGAFVFLTGGGRLWDFLLPDLGLGLSATDMARKLALDLTKPGTAEECEEAKRQYDALLEAAKTAPEPYKTQFRKLAEQIHALAKLKGCSWAQ